MTDSGPGARAMGSREDIIHRAWLLREALDARGVVELLSGVPRDVLMAELELTHLLAWGRTGVSDFRGSLDLQRSGEARVRARGNDRLLRWWLLVAGRNWLSLGDSRAARESWSECLDLASRVDDQYSVAFAANNLGGVDVHLGCLGEAFANFQRALAAHQRRGDLHGLAVGFHNLAALDLERERYDHALGSLGYATDYSRFLGSERLLRWHDVTRASVHVGLGDFRTAEVLLARSSSYFSAQEAWFEQVNVLTVLGACARRAGRLSESRARLAEALRLARRVGLRLHEALAWIELALLEDFVGHPRRAARAGRRALRILEDFGSTYYWDRHRGSLSPATLEAVREIAGATQLQGGA